VGIKIINISRLGLGGTGMLVFARRFLSELKKIDPNFIVVCSSGVAQYLELSESEYLCTPSFITNTKAISFLRPILWVLYSFYLGVNLTNRFGRSSHLITLTHHPIAFFGGRQTVAIHDVRPYYFPDSFLQWVMFRFFLPAQLKKIDSYITVSNQVKNQLIELYSLNESNIYVISNVCLAGEFEGDFVPSKKKQFVCVGASWKHKNIHSFINNWQFWSDRYRLVVVCGKTKYFRFLLELVSKHNLNNSVLFLHDITFEELKCLYKESVGLIYPSLDEGFGIPPLEALLCGCVPVVNDIPVFHEVLGKSALYVNPNLSESWSNVIRFFDNGEYFDFDFSAYKLYDVVRLRNELKIFLGGIA
jgi:glycosyltransferase involved in cell wall biosynthesis